MSLQDDPNDQRTTIRVAIITGVFAVIIVCLIGSFITLNTLISHDFLAGWPSTQTGQSNTHIVNASAAGVKVGFDFTNQAPEGPAGDATATSHLFVHRYPVPGAGFVTGVTYLNDRELDSAEIPEAITLLILRPVAQGWKVVYNVPLPADDAPSAGIGTTILKLEPPLPVEKGDIFAHWQAGATGPIPLNYEDAVMDGLSAGQYGFKPGDLQAGQFIRDAGFSGRRDYFIDLLFEAIR
jgi:hypothetical protein